MKKDHIRRRNKPINIAEQLNYPCRYSEEMVSPTERHVAWISRTEQLKLPMKMKKSTLGSNQSEMIVAQSEVHNYQIRLQTHFSNVAPSRCEPCILHWRPYKIESFDERSAHTVNNMMSEIKNRDDFKWEMIWDELCADGSLAIMKNSRLYWSVTVVSATVFRHSCSGFRNPCTAEGYHL